MKRLLILITLLLVPFAAAKIEQNCYQNFTAIRCGEQLYFNQPDYCKSINLTINECYTEGGNFTVVFSGIDYFKVPDPVSRVTFSFYSRSWAWLGDEKNTPLPENSSITAINDSAFIISANLGKKVVESVQITVPFCYTQVDSDREKIYPKTQAGKICEIRTAEVAEGPAATESQETNKTEVSPPAASAFNKNWVLLALLAVIIIIGFVALRPRKKRKRKG